jgi:hypothetical protein
MGGGAMSVRALQRQLATLLPEARPTGGGSTLEIASQNNDAPRLISATLLEGVNLTALPVNGPPVPGFRAFLDGTQRSEVWAYLGAVPLVRGQVGAVVRERRDRRLHTWRAPLFETRIYVPRALVPSAAWGALTARFADALVDTTDGTAEVGSHPFAMRDAAVQRVRAHREKLELRLAEQWCESERDPLFIDGGISGSERVALSVFAVGVVKSHFTLYAEGAALNTVLDLAHRERSSVFLVTSTTRTRVASWYLRMREPEGRDPTWGLVRVEVAQPDSRNAREISARADEVSRWILAEASPLALPDGRWDKMAYGIWDCEEFLRATH